MVDQVQRPMGDADFAKLQEELASLRRAEVDVRRRCEELAPEIELLVVRAARGARGASEQLGALERELAAQERRAETLAAAIAAQQEQVAEAQEARDNEAARAAWREAQGLAARYGDEVQQFAEALRVALSIVPAVRETGRALRRTALQATTRRERHPNVDRNVKAQIDGLVSYDGLEKVVRSLLAKADMSRVYTGDGLKDRCSPDNLLESVSGRLARLEKQVPGTPEAVAAATAAAQGRAEQAEEERLSGRRLTACGWVQTGAAD